MDNKSQEIDPKMFKMLAQKQALRLELQGMKRRGPSAFSVVKKTYNLSGNRQSVFTQFCELCEQAKAGAYTPPMSHH